jgi:DNA segregation ATPase FtsK/SpoIIIE-like protein
MTPNALRRRGDLVVALAHLVPELPDDEREAAVLVVAWLAKSIAAEKLAEPDPQYGAAAKLVARSQRCSISWLQRKLGLGYDRAAAIVAEMEARGLVGPAARRTARCWFVGHRSEGRPLGHRSAYATRAER